MPYPLPLTRTEAYLAYKAGVIQQSDLKPSLAIPRNGIDAWLAYWTGLAADYPKREDGTPHILQEEEAYIAYLCGIINEYPEKCLRRVGAYLRYLISARWGRPDHPLNREELYLSLIKTQVIPSGDPSSDIVIDGTAKAPFVDVKMYGDTFQQTYTGKNLTPYPYAGRGNSRGITFTANDDGTVTLNGKNDDTGISNYYLFNGSMTLSAGTYYMVVPPEENILFVVRIGDNYYGFNAENNYRQVFNSSVTISEFYIQVRKGVTTQYNNAKVYPMLSTLSGQTSADYEPYVGGQPSPSPDYPQPIQTVTGRQVVSVTGKNLYRSNNQTTTWDGASVITDGSEITFTGNSGGDSSMSYIRQGIPISIPSGTTLTVSAKTVSGEAWGSGVLRVGIRLNYSDGTNSNIYIPDYYPSNFGTTKSTTITLGKDVIGMNPAGLSYSAKGITNPVTFVCQLEKGSTATTYEPYSSNDYEINLGKNLFDVTATPWSKGIAYNSDGELVYWNGYVGIVGYQPVEPETTYTFSNSLGKGFYYGLVFYDKDKTKISNITADIKTFTTPKNCKFIRFAIGNDVTEKPTWTQIELGSNATAYAPYFTPIELCKLGTYQDYIYKDGDDWKVHKATAIASASNRVWEWANVPPSGWYFTHTNYGFYDINKINVISKSFIGVKRSVAPNTSGAFITIAGDGSIGIRNPNITGSSNITQFTNWLNSLNTTWLYALTTPTDTVITNQALIDQLNALKQGGAEEGTTYIKVSATDPNLPAKLYVEAPKYE